MRLFISLVLPDAIKDDLDDLQSRLGDVRITPYDNLHLTLAFLGDTPDRDAEQIHEALVALPAPCFDLTLMGGTVFGGRHGHAVAVMADGGPDLVQLHDRIRSRLHGAGLIVERRRFRPHVTLARLPGRGDPGPAVAALQGARVGPHPVSEFSLVSSHLHEDGARHDSLATYPLIGARMAELEDVHDG